MPNSGRTKLQGSISKNRPSRTRSSNPKRRNKPKEKPSRSVHRETDESSGFPDSIYSLKFSPKEFSKTKIVIGEFHDFVKSEQDALDALSDLNVSCHEMLKDLHFNGQTMTPITVFQEVSKHIETGNSDDIGEIHCWIKKDIMVSDSYELHFRAYEGFDDFYWISITWFLEKFGKNKVATDLFYHAIYLLHRYAHISALPNSSDEYYIERIGDEIENVKDNWPADQIDIALKDYQETIDCYKKGSYRKQVQLIKSQSKKKIKFAAQINKFKPKTDDEEKLKQWFELANEILLNKWKTTGYYSDEMNQNGELDIDSMIRFIYTRDTKIPMGNVAQDLEDEANNNGVSAFELHGQLNDKYPQIIVPEELLQIKHLMNFENDFEKWTNKKTLTSTHPA